MKAKRCILFLMIVLNGNFAIAQSVALPGTHAHNDYANKHPLFDALQYGFTGIEVDVILFNEELYVAHDFVDSIASFPTLQSLYLQPLDSIMYLNGGKLYPDFEGQCYLMIDIKTDAQNTYKVLLEQLETYRSWLYPNGKKGMRILLSGNRPVQTILKENNPLVALDGRPDDIGNGYSSEQMPVISQAFHVYSNWHGRGEMSDPEKNKIRILAEEVHRENKKLRLWAIPDNPGSWALLKSLGVDIINTDNLGGLSKFLTEK